MKKIICMVMALLMVQPGYRASTCRYPAQRHELPEVSFEEVACQLELALGLFTGEKEEEPLEGDGTEETEEKPREKTLTEEEWEELLMVGAIILLRAALTLLIHWEIKNEMVHEPKDEKNG